MNQVNEFIAKLREDFMKGSLSEADVLSLPYLQFEAWLKDAVDAKVLEPQATTLSTVDSNNKPSARIIYLRELKENKYWFYTNYNSRKAANISKNNNVCLTFFWPELERQVRIEGFVEKATSDQSDNYFNVRPRESQIGAWSSQQSSLLKDRTELEKTIEKNTTHFFNQPVPRPEFWGGYVITANYYEFWQGRKSRLHDRISYKLQDNEWLIERLSP